MAITEKAVAVFELSAYIPILNVLLVILSRHRTWRGQFGWIFLVYFSLIRIAGGVLELLSVYHPSNTGEAKAAAILQSIGLGPLLLTSLFLIKRV